MEFRLIYQGPLPAEKCQDKQTVGGGGYGRAKDKHRLRKHFHPQLRELWAQHPDLRKQAESLFFKVFPGEGDEGIVPLRKDSPPAQGAKNWVEHIADDHTRCGGRFVPLVSERGGFTCSLDILFLRRDGPGNLIENGGDIDNRVKVLLDGLRMPTVVPEMGGYGFEADEDPFFCLLEDDKLVTKISVTTDRLIVPQKAEEQINDVALIIHVTIVNPSALFTGGRLV